MDRLRRPGWTVEHIAGLDTGGAHRFLREHAATGIVVTPSLPDGDNFPFTVLETTLAGGIRLLASRIGGIPEILGPEGDSCLFEPAPEALAAKIAECMRSPDAARPQPYDCQASNQRWLAFHQEVLASRTPPVSLSARPAAAQLDVCIPYFNMARTFGQTLESLARQTCRHFKVFAIDDGSTDPAARAEFDKLADLYANRGWTFFRTGNGWVDAARNRAAARGQGKYLLFLDADDVLPPQALDRLLECIEATGDDCLIPAMRGFTGDASPLNGAGDIVAPAVRWMMPLGPALTAAIGNPAVLGGPVAILRRAAFEAIGGYRERRLVNEDWELLVRLRLRGYRVEVIPEYLHLYRMDGAGLSTTKDPGEPPLRLLEASEETLGPLGLQDLPALLWAHHRKAVSPPWDAQALRYGKEVQAPAFLRPLQMFYRQALPPAWRLRIHELVLRPLIRIRRSLP
jgi:GT2 family glycosyltransferase